jgi:hypothetical protein
MIAPKLTPEQLAEISRVLAACPPGSIVVGIKPPTPAPADKGNLPTI